MLTRNRIIGLCVPVLLAACDKPAPPPADTATPAPPPAPVVNAVTAPAEFKVRLETSKGPIVIQLLPHRQRPPRRL